MRYFELGIKASVNKDMVFSTLACVTGTNIFLEKLLK